MQQQLPEYHKFDEFQTRSQKLSEIKELGIDPYPHKFHALTHASALEAKFEGDDIGHFEDAEAGTTEHTVVSGRMVLFRAMGKNAFGHIQDESGRIQILFNRDHTEVYGYNPENVNPPAKPIKFIEKKIDLGDIIGIEGHLFRTQKGELTVYAKKVYLLCKTLLPLPDKHAGLADKGVRYRKRWLDLISNHEVINTFKKRSEIIRAIREYMHDLNFMEVETPVLQNTYGGASARPFTTELNALDHQKMYLRISLEIPLKKLIVGGLSKVYEMGKVFRNEGIDKTHNPEFTELEMYAANWDYENMMEVMENLFAFVAKKLFGTTKIGTRYDKKGNAHEVDLKTPWIRMSMKDSIKKYAQIGVDSLSDDQMKAILVEKTDYTLSDLVNKTRGHLISYLFEELVEEHLIQPHHIIDHPIETTPLCKLHREVSLREEKFVERFESFILGFEFSNAYSELNDPILQRELLQEQSDLRDTGDEEAHPMDEEFIESICQGMPPTGGLGIGIDRMIMLMLGETSIRDVLFFPLMRHE